MGITNWIKTKVKAYVDDAKERKEFQRLVAKQTKPIRREAYLQQKIKEAVSEGKEIAKTETMAKKKKTPKDFGLNNNFDAYKFLRKEKEEK